MLSYPKMTGPPSLTCPLCFSPADAYHAFIQQARYACGTTTSMLANDYHVSGETPRRRRDMIATWRRLCAGVGYDDRMEGEPYDKPAAERLARDHHTFTADLLRVAHPKARR